MSYIIDDEVLEKIRAQVDIVDLISDYLPLKKSGSNYMGLCPFHNEKTPSFSVSPTKGIFKCFGCGVGGDHISFIMQKENLSFREAVEFLANKYNIELKEYKNNESKQHRELREKIYEANRDAAIYYMNCLTKSSVALNYLKNRSIDKSIILKFGIGYSPDGWTNLYDYLKSKGYRDEELEAANLISKSKRGTYIDRFRNRIMFPILDISKRVIAFGGRTLDSSIPKYLNSSDTIIFNKGDNLYNINKVKEENKTGKIILVEGYMDVISLYKSGINYSVASLGTAFTENQAKLIKKYAEEVYICYDSDQAGIRATDRAIDILLSQNVKPKIIQLTDGMDPDDFVRKYGKLDFELELSKAVTYLDYKIAKIKSRWNLNSSEGIVGFTTEVSDLLIRLKNPIERDVYIDKISKNFGIKSESIISYIQLKGRDFKSKLKKDKFVEKKNLVKKEQNSLDVKKSRAQIEVQLISYLIHGRDLFNIVDSNLESYEFSGMKERDAFEIIKNLYTESDLDNLEEHIKDNKLISEEYLSKLMGVKVDLRNSTDILKELIDTIKNYSLEDRRDKLLEKIKSLDGKKEFDVQELNGLIDELNELNLKLNLPG
ncbi:DNA primase [Peptoniphilus asaccharolyticus DSM 20463]|uniref:DNA primase n=1 Tax=Peptoniphilus asaccharolyticus DSM 20463 TaxID=573058 RepID=A0A1W1UTQ6_PEPAS|nr:DNA primase [Peptoniphilus asaccharolyticus]MBL7575176.1 DNA primase [Peptoniphilus asaccharolyticus]SMB84487.1 DNA primase [Peptoniphilus asaccharolyticus DSM 20463]